MSNRQHGIRQSTFNITAIIGAVGVFLAPGVASAACPGQYATASCSAQSSYEVCESINEIWRCKPDVSSTGQGVSAYLVWDPVNLEYSSYGTADNGTDFCCTLSNTAGLEEVHLYGSDQSDTLLALSDPANGMNADAYGASMVKGRVFGGNGDDEIHGSDVSSSTYSEHLHGEAGADIILGNGGDDLLIGGTQADYMDGGDGADDLVGEAGPDVMLGGAGDDVLNGGRGSDSMNGDSGSDHLLGDEGNDFLCGGGYTGIPDAFDGGDGPDQICGQAGGLETGTGGPKSDKCYDVTILVDSCSTTLTYDQCLNNCP
ncbi:MAG: hypothetical protein H6739_07105 [Alphaproteobacteria bacterium]|nr:hypothetical protein [Alphaproteobacteria bacterium]